MLITPTGLPYGRMRPEDIVEVALAGGWTPVPGRAPSSERAVHAALYRARPDVSAIVHAHPVHGCALAVLRRPLPALLDEVLPVLGGTIAVADYAPSGDPSLGDSAVRALGNRWAVILANHGTVTVGADLEQAFYRLEVLERASAVYLAAARVGDVTLPG